MSQGDSGDLADIDMPTLLYRLPGVRFPADKDEVVRTAESNDAPRELVERVRNADAQRFETADEVLRAVREGR
jgi:Protein of unknown function (DUF2795)